MKFINLTIPVKHCNVGEIVRLSGSKTIVKITAKDFFTVTVLLLSGLGTSKIDSTTRVHRQID